MSPPFSFVLTSTGVRTGYMSVYSNINSIMVLTGAGISAASGLDTFRDKGGIWAQYDYREVATPEGYARNPDKVHDFYNMRRRQALTVEPNAAHFALARLEREWHGDFLLVTQNVDGLHEAAGSEKLLHMHGELNSALCQSCGKRMDWKTDMDVFSACPVCEEIGYVRPDIVWFGEMPYHVDEINKALAKVDLFISIGTSGTVFPAAGFALQARTRGAFTVEINLEPSTPDTDLFTDSIKGLAEETVPLWVDRLLSR